MHVCRLDWEIDAIEFEGSKPFAPLGHTLLVRVSLELLEMEGTYERVFETVIVFVLNVDHASLLGQPTW